MGVHSLQRLSDKYISSSLSHTNQRGADCAAQWVSRMKRWALPKSYHKRKKIMTDLVQHKKIHCHSSERNERTGLCTVGDMSPSTGDFRLKLIY